VIDRRGFLSGLVGVLAAPAIVRCASLMELRGVPLPANPDYAELVRITKRAFTPRLQVQSYSRPPWLDIDWDMPAFEFEAIEAVRAER